MATFSLMLGVFAFVIIGVLFDDAEPPGVAALLLFAYLLLHTTALTDLWTKCKESKRQAALRLQLYQPRQLSRSAKGRPSKTKKRKQKLLTYDATGTSQSWYIALADSGILIYEDVDLFFGSKAFLLKPKDLTLNTGFRNLKDYVGTGKVIYQVTGLEGAEESCVLKAINSHTDKVLANLECSVTAFANRYIKSSEEDDAATPPATTDLSMAVLHTPPNSSPVAELVINELPSPFALHISVKSQAVVVRRKASLSSAKAENHPKSTVLPLSIVPKIARPSPALSSSNNPPANSGMIGKHAAFALVPASPTKISWEIKLSVAARRSSKSRMILPFIRGKRSAQSAQKKSKAGSSKPLQSAAAASSVSEVDSNPPIQPTVTEAAKVVACTASPSKPTVEATSSSCLVSGIVGNATNDQTEAVTDENVAITNTEIVVYENVGIITQLPTIIQDETVTKGDSLIVGDQAIMKSSDDFRACTMDLTMADETQRLISKYGGSVNGRVFNKDILNGAILKDELFFLQLDAFLHMTVYNHKATPGLYDSKWAALNADTLALIWERFPADPNLQPRNFHYFEDPTSRHANDHWPFEEDLSSNGGSDNSSDGGSSPRSHASFDTDMTELSDDCKPPHLNITVNGALAHMQAAFIAGNAVGNGTIGDDMDLSSTASWTPAQAGSANLADCSMDEASAGDTASAGSTAVATSGTTIGHTASLSTTSDLPSLLPGLANFSALSINEGPALSDAASPTTSIQENRHEPPVSPSPHKVATKTISFAAVSSPMPPCDYHRQRSTPVEKRRAGWAKRGRLPDEEYEAEAAAEHSAQIRVKPDPDLIRTVKMQKLGVDGNTALTLSPGEGWVVEVLRRFERIVEALYLEDTKLGEAFLQYLQQPQTIESLRTLGTDMKEVLTFATGGTGQAEDWNTDKLDCGIAASICKKLTQKDASDYVQPYGLLRFLWMEYAEHYGDDASGLRYAYLACRDLSVVAKVVAHCK